MVGWQDSKPLWPTAASTRATSHQKGPHVTWGCPLLHQTLPRAQRLQDRIKQQYRVRLILDNLPITTYDLELDPESGGCGVACGMACAVGWAVMAALR